MVERESTELSSLPPDLSGNQNNSKDGQQARVGRKGLRNYVILYYVIASSYLVTPELPSPLLFLFSHGSLISKDDEA